MAPLKNTVKSLFWIVLEVPLNTADFSVPEAYSSNFLGNSSEIPETRHDFMAVTLHRDHVTEVQVFHKTWCSQ